MLRVQLHKNTGKNVILKCIRQDNSITWSKLHPNTEYHDLAHMVIEEVLLFKNSFFGMISNGINISDFELPEHQKPEALKGNNLPKESLVTEHLVNLLMIEHFNATSYIDFLNQAQHILTENKLPFPTVLTEEKLATIRKEYKLLINSWHAIENGKHLEKTFEL
ncbi:hypothetical protein [Dokdonia sp.]|uniref:hypothetical protein n=1 Tax=Dokdonia sp. TaxID=2024995 RepID=UPI003262FF9E